MRNFLGVFNLLAVSANTKQSAMGTAQTLDTGMMCDRGDIINLEPRRETNEDALIGHLEPDRIYNLGALTGFNVNFNRAEAQHFAFLYAYAGFDVVTTALGSGYKHVMTPAEPGPASVFFTGSMRYGKTIFKRRFADLLIQAVTATFTKDAWAKVKGDVRGSGKYEENITEEIVNAAYNAASLILAGTTVVQGATSAARLDSVHKIRREALSGEWENVPFSAVSGAGPGVITITPGDRHATGTAGDITFVETGSQINSVLTDFLAAGIVAGDTITVTGSVSNAGPFTVDTVVDHRIVTVEAIVSESPAGVITVTVTSLVDYKILYVPVEAAWATFPARVDESPLRVSNLVLKLGGAWDPVGLTYDGGYTLGEEIASIEHSITNEVPIEFRIGGTGTHANYALLKDRVQALKLNRELRDFMIQNYMGTDTTETFAVRMTATGALYDGTYPFLVDLVFPKVGVLTAPLSVGEKVIAEAGDLKPMYDAVSGYSVRIEIHNTVASYAAAP
jgi:hypothetical protein